MPRLGPASSSSRAGASTARGKRNPKPRRRRQGDGGAGPPRRLPYHVRGDGAEVVEHGGGGERRFSGLLLLLVRALRRLTARRVPLLGGYRCSARRPPRDSGAGRRLRSRPETRPFRSAPSSVSPRGQPRSRRRSPGLWPGPRVSPPPPLRAAVSNGGHGTARLSPRHRRPRAAGPPTEGPSAGRCEAPAGSPVRNRRWLGSLRAARPPKA